MRIKESQLVKEARIIKYWEELSRLRLDISAAIELISYIFSISERRILEIIKEDPAKYANVELPHLDLEIDLIESFYDKIKNKARMDRQNDLQAKN